MREPICKPWHILAFGASMAFPPFFLVIFADMLASMARAITPEADDPWWDADEPLGGRW